MSAETVVRAEGFDEEVFRSALAAATVDAPGAPLGPAVAAAVRVAGVWHSAALGTLDFGDAHPVTTETPFRVASLSKPLSAVLAGRLVDAGAIDLDEPVSRWMPELASPRVLDRPDGPLDAAHPATTPITLRHLLTQCVGSGVEFVETPLGRELSAFGYGPKPPAMTPDEFLARFAALPLGHEPGSHWDYHTSTEVLSVLLARVAGRPLDRLLHDEIVEPLGLAVTGFSTTEPLPRQYRPTADGIEPWDDYADLFAAPPAFPSLAGGLVASLDDLMCFWGALADGELLPPGLHARMTSDQLSREQHEGMAGFGGDAAGYGWQVGVTTTDADPNVARGAYGWSGGTGTTAAVDPQRGVVGIALSQRFVSGPDDDYAWFWRPLHAALR
ncbi:serine hydrolase [Schumannella luteola]|uniref:CubicO group peptidase (Beta-lactamase class C family) n=1 Tax=Schumannella luteola TaxID=472059 RepID=A0A852Y897_9MICO|nr:serine hydrolase domain-containing protein [Schumannella luteola]NYG99166.1 CubicO group peptidase (beta-lactamase class C family) [Schumannella luteola]TPX03699.1 beta-lactamase family protein [Schumannella luteola]